MAQIRDTARYNTKLLPKKQLRREPSDQDADPDWIRIYVGQWKWGQIKAGQNFPLKKEKN